MELEERNGAPGSGKEAPFSSPELVITYKRRKRDRPRFWGSLGGEPSISAGKKQKLKLPHQTNGTYEDGQARIVHNWRNVLEQIAQPGEADDDCGIPSCIQRALKCGPLGFSCKDRHKSNQKIQTEAQRRKSSPSSSLNADQKHKAVTLDGSQNTTNDQTFFGASIAECQNVFFDVLISWKFALLCDLLSENFQGSKAMITVGLSSIISKMKNGIYKQSPELFDQDIQLVWENYQKIGQEMAFLASSLSEITQASCQKQMKRCLGRGPDEQKCECTNHVAAQEKISVDSYTMSQFTCYESKRSTKPEQTDIPCLYKVTTCEKCGNETDGKDSLICDGCEVVYHISCTDPAAWKFSARNWYCAACSNKRGSADPGLTNDQQDSQHQNCAVCDRLEDSGCLEQNLGAALAANSSRECSVSSMESEEEEFSRTAMLRLCKKCGTCEDEDKRFLICSNIHCYYKYYHIRCLKSTQVASQHQKPNCWYCPSCLCRACLTDKDDNLVCMCDGCDEAYHSYCMNPRRTTIPTGMWYCFNCNLERARKGMRRYEHWVLQKHGKNVVKLANGDKQPMDMLLSAAEKLRTEESVVAAITKNR